MNPSVISTIVDTITSDILISKPIFYRADLCLMRRTLLLTLLGQNYRFFARSEAELSEFSQSRAKILQITE